MLQFSTVACYCNLERIVSKKPDRSGIAQLQYFLKALWFTVVLFLGEIRACLGDDSRLFPEQVVPLLVEKCFCCHGGATLEGGYSVADTGLLFKPGDSGTNPVSFDNLDSSELLLRLTSEDATVRMPLDAEPLATSEIDSVRRWLRSGAKVDAGKQPTPLVEIYGQSKKSARAPNHYSKPFPISSLLLSSDGRFLLVGGYSEVLVWNVEKQSLDSRLPTRGRMITDLNWAPGGQLIAASGAPGRFGVIEAFDFATRMPISTFGFSRDVCSSVAASPYRNEIVAGFADGSVILFSLDEFKPRVSSVPHAAGVTSVHWSSKDNRIFSASLDRTAKSFEAKDGHVLFAYSDHERTVGGVVNTQFGPITLDETGTLRLWSEGEEVRSIAKFEGLPQRVQHVVCSNGFVFVADHDRIRRMLIVQDEIEDDKAKDKDKSAPEKPKKKKRTRIQEKESLQSIPNRSVASVTTNSNGLFAAGLDTGQVVIWRIEESTSPWKTWHAQP